MKYGDVVTYVRNGVALNALVLHSQQAEDGEHLIVAYADPEFSGNGIARAIATAFDVKPFVEGANQGWQYIPKGFGQAISEAFAAQSLDDEKADDLRAHVEAATAVLTK